MALWLKLLGMFKKSKTVYNAPAHFNNASNNIMLRYVAEGGNPFENMTASLKMMDATKDIDDLTVKTMAGSATKEDKKLLSKLKKENPYVIEARDIGLFGKSQLNDIIRDYKGSSEFGKKTGIINSAAEFAQKAYSGGDEIVRLAMYITKRSKGIAPKEAQREIERILPDYTRPLPYGIKVLRDSGIAPFISWSYYVLPNILKIAKEHPFRAAAVIGSPMLLSESTMRMQNQSNTNLPADTQGRRLAYNKDKHGNIDTVKVDRIIPGYDIANIPLSAIIYAMDDYKKNKGILRAAYKGVDTGARTGMNFLSSTVASGPLVTAGIGALTGIDSYTLRPIIGTKKNQSPKDEIENRALWAVNSFAPIPQEAINALSFGKSFIKSEDKRTRANDIVPRTSAQEASRLVGLNSLTYKPNAKK